MSTTTVWFLSAGGFSPVVFMSKPSCNDIGQYAEVHGIPLPDMTTVPALLNGKPYAAYTTKKGIDVVMVLREVTVMANL